MATDTASADTKQAKGNQPPPAREPPADGAAAASAAPTSGALGQQLLRARTGVGSTSDPVERSAEQAADRVLRMPAPATKAPEPPPAAGAPEVRRSADPAPPQKGPATPTVPPATGATGVTGGTGPSTVTPAGPAPMVSAPVTAGQPRVETGAPAPDAEPPAPEGEAPARDTPVVPPKVQGYLDASRGKGAPLPEAVRTDFEARFQRPFDDVRLHDDAGADDAARQVDALAFTRGNDIYFRSGAYDPATEPGRHLLAHELAHVVQQRPGVNRKPAPGLGAAMIRRVPAKEEKGTETRVPVDKPKGTIDISKPRAKTLQLDELRVPGLKAKPEFVPATIRWRRANETRSGKQREIWRTSALADTKTALTAKLKALGIPTAESYELQGKAKGPSSWLFVGRVDDIAEALVIPPWNSKGDFARWEVDHKAEWQISGPDEDPANLWLLDPTVNNESGNAIKTSIRKQIDDFLIEANKKLVRRQTTDGLKGASWTVTWDHVTAAGGPQDNPDKRWKRDDVKTPAFMAGLEQLPPKRRGEVTGSSDRLAVFRRRGGGQVRHIDLHKGKGEYHYQSRGSKLRSIEWSPPDKPASAGGHGTVRGNILKKGVLVENPKAELEVPIARMPGVEWGGYLDSSTLVAERARLLRLTAASPVSFDELEFDLDSGLTGHGRVPTPTVPLLEHATIEVVLDDGEVGLAATVTGDELTLPGPFKIEGGALRLSATTGGLMIAGQVDFEIEKLATGFIRASAAARTGSPAFELEGRLNFDSKMFSTAALGLSYKNGEWGVSGELITAPKAIKGIKSGRAKVEVKDGTVTATGEFEPELKGLKKGTLGFRYDQATGMEITGEILIGEGIPGIKSGRMAATIKEGPDKHSLSGDVTIEPAVPGLTGSVTGKYDDGALLVDASLGYEKDYAKGTLHVGVTNQAVGADGKPAGPPKPDGSLLVYGDGSVTLTLTPWLKGTVGLKLKTNGEVEVSGEVALPPTFNVFDEQKIKKELLSAHVDIPIVGVSVLGQRIGIFATVGGSLSIDAGVGPGQLRDTAVRVTYNPARPEATTVSGNATFAVPAHAALRLDVHGGLGVGIPVVSATAGLNVYGEIGVFGEASASTAVSWSPSAGVVLDANASIFVEPKFKFGIDAYVDVSADLWIKTIELYHETWKLAAFEYGSNLRFGLTLPVHYESGKPFVLGFDQIQWTYPHIEPKELVTGLVEHLVG